MRLMRCAKGHYYDLDLHTSCPACAKGEGTIKFSESQRIQAMKNLENARKLRESGTESAVTVPVSDDPLDWSQEQIWEYGPYGYDTGVCANGHFYNEEAFGPFCPVCEEQKNVRKNSGDIRRCANGHIYDAKKHASCPRCAAQQPAQEPVSQQPSGEKFDLYRDGTEPLEEAPNIVQCPRGHSYNARVYGVQHCPVCENKQIIRETKWKRYFADRSPDEVWRHAGEVEALDDMPVNWNACLAMAGNHRRYVAVQEGLNAIGRGAGNHIVIPSDPTVAFREHAFLLCDTNNKTYYLIGGRMGGETRLNGSEIRKAHAQPLRDGDAITFGRTAMVFFARPFPQAPYEFDFMPDEPD